MDRHQRVSIETDALMLCPSAHLRASGAPKILPVIEWRRLISMAACWYVLLAKSLAEHIGRDLEGREMGKGFAWEMGALV